MTSIFRIDHRDRDIGAPDHAVNIGHLELLQDVLRGVTGLRRNALPSFATMIADQVKLSERRRLELEARIDRSNIENLWEQK